MQKYFILISSLLVLNLFGNEYFFLNQENDTNYYTKSENPFEVTNRLARLQNATEEIETNVISIAKPTWVTLAEGLYTKSLTEIGYEGAWTNLNITFEDVGLDLLLKMDQTNDLSLAEFATKKKSILESLYTSLLNYSKNYGITDMRLYPYGTSNILEVINTKIYILFNNEKYYKKEE